MIGVVLGGLTVSFGQDRIDEMAAAARPAVEHASLRPVEAEVTAPVPALPPELPEALGPESLEFDPDVGMAPEGAVPGERDPFRPFTLDLQPKVVAEDEYLTPLQRYDLQQLTVVGVLLDLEPPRAMLQDDAGMGFIVTPGTLIGRQHGVVTDVQHRRVIVEETFVDFAGIEQVRKAVLEMPDEDTISQKPGKKK